MNDFLGNRFCLNFLIVFIWLLHHASGCIPNQMNSLLRQSTSSSSSNNNQQVVTTRNSIAHVQHPAFVGYSTILPLQNKTFPTFKRDEAFLGTNNSPPPCVLSSLEDNKKRVTNFLQKTIGDNSMEGLDQFVRPDFIQHNPNIGDGMTGLVKFLTGNPMKFRQRLKLVFHRVMAEGNWVWVHWKLPNLGKMYAIVDIFRLDECGRIAEHWDVVQEITERVVRNSKTKHPFF